MTFLLTRPLRDVTWLEDTDPEYINISTHTPLAGRDAESTAVFRGEYRFLLTRPLRDVTDIAFTCDIAASISTHTPLAGRDLPHGRCRLV